MMGRHVRIKAAYTAVIILLSLVSFRFFVYDRIQNLRLQNSELEIRKRLYQIKEINYLNADANENALKELDYYGAGLTDYNEIVFASLYIGEMLAEYGLIETGLSYDKLIDWAVNYDQKVVQTRISCSFTGDYKAAMEFLAALRGGKYCYYLKGLRLSSVGMEENMVSVVAELFLFSILPDGEDEEIAEKLGVYNEEFGYENPFYYER